MIEYSGGNVFADLGLKNAAALLAKADLMHAITREVRARGLTSRQAARLTGLSEPDILDIARNEIDQFSQRRLLRTLTLLRDAAPARY